MCTPCAQALRATVKGRTGPRPSSDYIQLAPSPKVLAKQARKAKRAARAARRLVYPIALAALAVNKAALIRAREAATVARRERDAARAARAAAIAAAHQPYTDHAAWQAAQALLPVLWARVRAAIQVDRAAVEALRQARTVSRQGRRYYAEICRGTVPIDPTA